MNYRSDTLTQSGGKTLEKLSIVFNPHAPRILPVILWFSVVLFTLINTPSYTAITARSDVDGITVEFNLPDLRVTPVERDGVKYQSVSYESCGFTSEEGNPYLPVSRILLGVPADTSFSVEVLHAANETRMNHRLPPVPRRALSRENDLLTSGRHRGWSAEQIQAPDRGVARRWRRVPSGRHVPLQLGGQIVYEGYMRSQRVICLALHPVQYSATSRLLRLHPRMVVRLHFHAAEPDDISTYRDSTFSKPEVSFPDC